MTSSTALLLDDLLTRRLFAPSVKKPTTVSNGSTHGPFSSKYRGQGLDFDDLRHYVPGDDIRHIDWKVSARYQQTMTRLFREERDSTLTLAVDARGLMFTGTQTLRIVSAGHTAAALAWHAVQLSQRIAATVLTDNDIFVATPQSGERGALQVCRTVCEAFDHQSEHTHRLAKSQSTNTLSSLLDVIIQGGRQMGSTILLSGFDDCLDPKLAHQLSNSLAVVQAKHRQHSQLLCALQIVDTAEVTALPPGRYGYRQVAMHQRSVVTPSNTLKLQSGQRSALQKVLNQQTEAIEAMFESHNVHSFRQLGPITEDSLKELINRFTHYGLFK